MHVVCIHSFIHIEHLYSASSRKLLRSAPNASTVKRNSACIYFLCTPLPVYIFYACLYVFFMHVCMYFLCIPVCIFMHTCMYLVHILVCILYAGIYMFMCNFILFIVYFFSRSLSQRVVCQLRATTIRSCTAAFSSRISVFIDFIIKLKIN